eukprot:scaffold1531_cov296-Prasinococcus_capsulatus_cf.AAC.9
MSGRTAGLQASCACPPSGKPSGKIFGSAQTRVRQGPPATCSARDHQHRPRDGPPTKEPAPPPRRVHRHGLAVRPDVGERGGSGGTGTRGANPRENPAAPGKAVHRARR